MSVKSPDRIRQENSTFYSTYENESADITAKHVFAGAITTLATCALGFIALRYRVAGPSHKLVRTGLGIKGDMDISNRAVIWPFQKGKMFSVEARTLKIDIEAMSQERIPVTLPFIVNIGPDWEDSAALKRYCRILSEKSEEEQITSIIGIIEGDVRVLVANLGMNEIFSDRLKLKTNVHEIIKEGVSTFGFTVYSTNVKDLHDAPGNDFLNKQKMRALTGVDQKASIDIAEANKQGDIGAQIHKTETIKTLADLQAQAIIAQNTKQIEVEESRAGLAIRKYELEQDTKIAAALSAAASEKKTFELQTDVEKERANTLTEKERATKLSGVNVNYEVVKRNAEANAQAIEIDAIVKAKTIEIDAIAKGKTVEIDATANAKALEIKAAAEANAIKIKAEAEANARVMLGKADYEVGLLEAQVTLAKAEAEAEGLAKLTDAAGGSAALATWKLVEGNKLKELAHEQSKAVQDMKPNINVWTTGNQGDGGNSFGNVLGDLTRAVLPLNDVVSQYTGMNVFGGQSAKKSRLVE